MKHLFSAYHQGFYTELQTLLNSTLEKISQKIISENKKEYSKHYLKIEKKGEIISFLQTILAW